MALLEIEVAHREGPGLHGHHVVDQTAVEIDPCIFRVGEHEADPVSLLGLIEGQAHLERRPTRPRETGTHYGMEFRRNCA